MARSKIEICNIALGFLGADPIRDFSEVNKRARMCELFYDFTRNALLAAFDWPFARNIVKLQVVVDDKIHAPLGYQIFQVPADCAAARNIEPEGTQWKWFIQGDKLLCDKPGNVYLRYTRFETNVTKYSATFCDLLAMGTAIKLCMPITQDKKLFETLAQIYNGMQVEAYESDANIGTMYKEHDNDPNNDTFVTAGGNGNVVGTLWESID